MSALVFVEQRPDQGKEHVPEAGATIGREGCDMTIPDAEISRRHARLLREDDALVIEDLDSSNGTFVNGERISGKRSLKQGDEVRFGDTVWLLQPAAGATRIAQDVIADPQVTRARAVPEPPTEPQPPAVASPRGDVPAPDFQPSAIRRVVPPQGVPVAFNPGDTRRDRGSAATRLSATVGATVAVALTAAGVVAYYVTEPFK